MDNNELIKRLADVLEASNDESKVRKRNNNIKDGVFITVIAVAIISFFGSWVVQQSFNTTIEEYTKTSSGVQKEIRQDVKDIKIEMTTIKLKEVEQDLRIKNLEE
jgi:hypothetical protein